jgi:hypothetical protein
MAGTTAGLHKAWEVRRSKGHHLRHAFYAEIGRKSHVGAFGQDPDFASKAAKERWRRDRIRRSWQTRRQK